MTAKLIDNVLVLSNPALMVIPGVEDSYSDFNQLPPLDRNYPLSLEMIDFLVRYDMGSYTDSEAHRRCFKIGIRKGCYGNRLINDFGFLTETGREALSNAKTLDRRLKHYYERARKTWLTPATAKDMDEIVPFGTMPGFALRMMTYLWEAALPEDSDNLDNSDQNLKIKKTVPMPHNWTISRTAVEGDVYLLMSSIRNNMYARQAADVCLKFGLIDLVPLPKALHSQGRGRAPLGITLSPAGNRFYESYLEAFDPQRKFQQYVKTSYRAAHPEEFGDVPVPARPTATSTPTASSGYYSLRDSVESVEYEVYGPSPDYNPTAEPDVQDQITSQDQPEPAHQSQKGPVSDLPDIVDGENLRDLFG